MNKPPSQPISLEDEAWDELSTKPSPPQKPSIARAPAAEPPAPPRIPPPRPPQAAVPTIKPEARVPPPPPKPLAPSKPPAAVVPKPPIPQPKAPIAQPKPSHDGAASGPKPRAAAEPVTIAAKFPSAEANAALPEAKAPSADASASNIDTKRAIPEANTVSIDTKVASAEAKSASAEASASIAVAKAVAVEAKAAVPEARPAGPWFAMPLRDLGAVRAARSGKSAPAAQGLDASVCVFWLNGRRFALETSAVTEVVAVEEIAPVPLAPAAVVGIFNLRGTPLTLVDLGVVLELAAEAAGEARGPAGRGPSDGAASVVAMVLEVPRFRVAGLIHGMDLVLPAGRGVYVPSHGAGEHPVVKGFLEVDGAGDRTVTVLDPATLAPRLERLKFR